MQKAACLSGLIHIVLVILFTLGLPNPFKRVITDDNSIVVNFADIAPTTTTPLITPESAKEKPDLTKDIVPKTDKIQENKPQKLEEVLEQKAAIEENKKEEEQEDVSTKNVNKIEEKNDVETEKKSDHFYIKEKPKEKDTKDQKKKEDKIKEDKKKEEKKKEKIKKEKQDKDNKKKKDGEKKSLVDLDNKDKKNINAKKKNDTEKKQTLDGLFNELPSEKPSKKGNTGANVQSISDTFTVSEIARLRAHIAKCWHVHAGAKNAKDQVVDIEIHLNKDAHVEKAEIVDQNRMKRDPLYKIAAETAQRSLLDPACNPLPVPKTDYKEWEHMTFRFDPKDML